MNFIDRKFKQLMEQTDLDEKLRDKKGLLKKPFRWKEFATLDQIRDIRNYTMDSLNFLGAGSSREVYLLSSRYALKIAKSKAGMAQNLYEYELSSDPKVAIILARVYDAHPQGLWIVSDLVRPLMNDYFGDENKGEKEFEKLMGFDFYDIFKEGGDFDRRIERALDDAELAKSKLVYFEQMLHEAERSGDIDAIRQAKNDLVDQKDLIAHFEVQADRLKAQKQLEANNPRLRKYKKAFEYAVEKYDLSEGGDSQTLSHWGKTPDGRVVFLDYGLSSEIYSQFYA